MMSACIFCSIIARKIPATIITENEYVLVIQDIQPKAPTHYLIIPKKHIESLCTIESNDLAWMHHSIDMAHLLTKKLLKPATCRLVMNNGKESGQSVFHAHLHFLSGKNFTDL